MLAANTVLVWAHHVARVVQPLNNGNAIVADEKGTYERSIRGAVIVDPNGNAMRSYASAPAIHGKHRARNVTTGWTQEERYRPL